MSRRAVVIGGSVAGLLAAAALSRSVDEVTVIDRDELPDGPRPRRRLPQARHAHVLLPSGRDAVEELLPGADVRKHLLAAGAREEPFSGTLDFGPRGWSRRRPTADDALLTCCSRDLFDWTLRDAVVRTTRVTIRRGEAVALLGSSGRVTGVRVVTDGGEAELGADLVVDASGRGSRAEQWLDALGVGGIRTDEVDAGLVCASRVFRVPPGARAFPLTRVGAEPSDGLPGRSGMLVPIEDDRWLVTLMGTRGGEPPADPADFLSFALDLRDPVIGRLISRAEPLGEVSVSRRTANRRRRFEKAALPEGLVVLGDAVATYNPVHWQGMSVAALGALALDRRLRAGDVNAPGFARGVQRAAARSVSAAFALGSSQDLWFPDVVGRAPSLADGILRRGLGRMERVATSSPPVYEALRAVTMLEDGRGRLLQPRLLLATLRGPVTKPSAEPPLTPQESAFLGAVGSPGH